MQEFNRSTWSYKLEEVKYDLGIGNDIVSVERIENLLDKFGERFISFYQRGRNASLKKFETRGFFGKTFCC